MTDVNHQVQNPFIKYNPQLDGLRFCAVLFVVTYHWLPSISHTGMSYFFGGFVNFFFVLSSYLITKILFSAKEKSRMAAIPKYKVMLVFLMRRTLRIFPAYYVFLVIVLFLPLIGSEVRNNSGMYFAYLSNYKMFYGQVWPFVTPHIWTLAVEEQFYLIWPLVILLIPHRHLLKTFLLILVGSVLARAIFYHPFPVIPQAILTQFCIDPFAIGGLLAYKYTISDDRRKMIDKYLNLSIYLAVPLVIVVIAMKSYYFSFVIGGLLFSVISMKIIEGAILGYKGFVGNFLQSKTVLYIGKISYGIYLYHILIPIVFWKIYDISYKYLENHHAAFFERNQKGIAVFVKIISSEASCFVIYASLSIGVAILSWNLVEKPFNKLKFAFGSGAPKAVLDEKSVRPLKL